MTDFKNFKGAAKRIDDIDLPRIAHRIGVGEDEMHALIDTETNGKGFDSAGRPRMLFEPHRFYANLSGAQRERAVKEGLARKTWKVDGKVPRYPSDSYPRLIKAMAINETAALKSASWGLGQVMGENHVSAGYDSPQAMVRAFMADEENHLEAMVNFIVTNHIDDDLRALAALTRPTKPEDCIPIVRVYNGSGFRDNNYHVKFADNHNKWRKIPDTAWSPETPMKAQPSAAPKPVARPAGPLDKKVVENVQNLLIERGYFEVGLVDGKFGSKTRGAIGAFEADNGLPMTGEISDELLAALVRAPNREVSIQRETATTADLREQGNKTVQIADWLKKVGTGVLVSMGLGGIGDGIVNFDTITKGVGDARSLIETLGTLGPWIIGAAVGGIALYYGTKIVREQVQAFREGRPI